MTSIACPERSRRVPQNAPQKKSGFSPCHISNCLCSLFRPFPCLESSSSSKSKPIAEPEWMYPESTPAEWLFHQEKATLRTIARAQLLWFCSKLCQMRLPWFISGLPPRRTRPGAPALFRMGRKHADGVQPGFHALGPGGNGECGAAQTITVAALRIDV